MDVIVASGMLPSKGEVRRMVKNGGVYLNNAKVGKGVHLGRRGATSSRAASRCLPPPPHTAPPSHTPTLHPHPQVTDDKKVVEGGDLIEGRLALLACGKKNKMLLRVEQ